MFKTKKYASNALINVRKMLKHVSIVSIHTRNKLKHVLDHVKYARNMLFQQQDKHASFEQIHGANILAPC